MNNQNDFFIENSILKDYKGTGGNIVIPDRVSTIGQYAFEKLNSPASITLSKDVIDIRALLLCDNEKIVEIKVVEENPEYSSQGGVLFNKDKRKLIRYPVGKSDAKYTIPDTVTKIEEGAFYGCKGLKSIIIPEGVTCIGESAFGNCENIQSVTIPKSVTKINAPSFESDYRLERIEVAEDNPSYSSQDGVLFNKDKTTIIHCPGGKTASEYIIPDTVIKIGEAAFFGCDKLSSVLIPDGVTNISAYAFAHCYSLRSVKLPNQMKRIGKWAFYCCNKLESISIPDSTIRIGEYAFFKCDKLASVSIPDGVTNIDSFAFANCRNLEYIKLPNQMKRINESTFQGCDKLASVSLPDGLTSIDGLVFDSCTSLTSVTIPNSVISISYLAFIRTNEKLTIYASEGSYAEQYAKKARIQFVNTKE